MLSTARGGNASDALPIHHTMQSLGAPQPSSVANSFKNECEVPKARSTVTAIDAMSILAEVASKETAKEINEVRSALICNLTLNL